MPLSPEFIKLIETTFDNSAKGTSSNVKRKALADMKASLLSKNDDEAAYNEFYKAVTKKDSQFSKALDIKTGVGFFSSSASSSRMAMDDLQRKLAIRLENGGRVGLGLMKDAGGHGFGKTLPQSGTKNAISGSYDLTPGNGEASLTKEQIETVLKKQEESQFISKGSLFNIFNKAGLDYKGQSNYAGLTLLKGGGLDVKVNLIGLFFPPAAALGFSGSLKASANVLRGRQMLVYSEVINGNNGNWTLPTDASIKESLINHLKVELGRLDPEFFDARILNECLRKAVTTEDLNDTSSLLDKISVIHFEKPPILHDPKSQGEVLDLETLAYLNMQAGDMSAVEENLERAASTFTTEYREGGIYAPDLCQAVERARRDAESDMSRATIGTDYSAIVVAGCMRSVAWEWMFKGGIEGGWSLLNVAALKEVMQYLSTTSIHDDSAQYVALGVSCSLVAESSVGQTNRSFLASDRSARIFAKGGGPKYDETYRNFSSYVSDCIRYATDDSLKEYIDHVFRSYYKSTSDYKSLSLDQLLTKTETKIHEFRNLKSIRNNEGNHRNDKWFNDALTSFMHIRHLLQDRIEQKSDDPISRFVIAYSGTTWEFAAKIDAKLSFKITTALKQGLWEGAEGSSESASGAKGLEMIGSLFNHARAYRTSRYTIQVPMIITTGTHQLPDEVNSELAMGGGMFKLHSLWEELPETKKAPSCLRFKTQETTIGYRKIETKHCGISEFADLKLENNAVPLAKMAPGGSTTLKERDKAKQPKPSDTFLNTIEYKTATAVWEPGTANRLRLTDGSGRNYGQAFVLTKLIELARDARQYPLPEGVGGKLKILANSLHVKQDQLVSFFKSAEFKAAMPDACPGNLNPWAKENFAAQEGCILIESTFAINNPGQYSLACNSRRSEDGLNLVPESVLDSKDLCDVNPANNLYTLQSIRLRYRMADLKEDKSTPFKLGLYLPGTIEVGIRVEEVENVGMAGIVDICTYWFGERASGTVIYNRDQTVASTVLITQ